MAICHLVNEWHMFLQLEKNKQFQSLLIRIGAVYHVERNLHRVNLHTCAASRCVFFGLLQVQLNDVILNTAIDIHGKGAPIGKAASNDALACGMPV